VLVKTFTKPPVIMQSCTLTTIAKAADLAVSTVSYALRNNPKIPLVTRQRVRKLAEKMGYKPHPAVSTLMAHIKSAHLPKSPTKIAFVWIEPEIAGLNSTFNRQSIAGARQRARERGYQLEEFRLFDPGMTSRRLSEILKTRGIAGIVFSGCDRRTSIDLEMDWNAHATAIIGNARCSPELHRAGHYHYMGMRRIMLELAARGYRRPAAVLESVVNERASRTWEAAFLAYHPTPNSAHASLKKMEVIDPPALAPWLKKCRPDVLIVTKQVFIAPLRKVLGVANRDMGFAVISLEEESPDVSGINPGHQMVAANAVDLVLEQLMRNETGVPEDPREMLFDGHWVEGRTLRPRQHRLEEFSAEIGGSASGGTRGFGVAAVDIG
jgi:LacI family transcriptional regulator